LSVTTGFRIVPVPFEYPLRVSPAAAPGLAHVLDEPRFVLDEQADKFHVVAAWETVQIIDIVTAAKTRETDLKLVVFIIAISIQ